MSLAVEIDISLDQKQISQVLKTPDERLRAKYKQDKHGTQVHVYLSGVHDFLSDNFDLGGQYIILDDEIKLPLQSYIKTLWQNASSTFEITFVWAGEKLNHHATIGIDDFLFLVEENKILNGSCYVITD